jgi:hypothetical protein
MLSTATADLFLQLTFPDHHYILMLVPSGERRDIHAASTLKDPEIIPWLELVLRQKKQNVERVQRN